MNTRALVVVDRWIGVPLCAALTLVRRLVDRGRSVVSGAPRKICFVKLIEQGSTVLAADALSRAVDMVGRSNVYFLVFSENRAILDALEIVPPENVIEIDSRSWRAALVGISTAVRRLWREGVDSTVDLEFFSRGSAILSLLSGAGRRVGFHSFSADSGWRGDLMTHRVQYNPYIHTSAAFSLLTEALLHDPAEVPLRKAPAPAKPKPPEFRPTSDERGRVVDLLRRHQIDLESTQVVLLNPNASDLIPLRKWPEERYIELGQQILARSPGIRIVLTGKGEEREAAERIASQISPERAVSLAGKTSLRELLTLFTLAKVLVTNDSGPAQFAALTTVHTVVLFGPETPALYGPIGDNVTVLYAGLACSPCVNVFNQRQSPCRDNVCMQAIPVDQVLTAVRRGLVDRGIAPPKAVVLHRRTWIG